MEVSLVIGIIGCGSSACPAPSADLGEVLFIGKYQSQGVIGNTLNSFENFTFVVPSDISGNASIQVQHNFLLTPPVSVFYKLSNGYSLVLQRMKRSLTSSTSASQLRSILWAPRLPFTISTLMAITPNAWIFLAEPTQMAHLLICTLLIRFYCTWIDALSSYDCNQSNSQKWLFNGNALTSVNPADGSQWCLDAGVSSQCIYLSPVHFLLESNFDQILTGANGVPMKIWQCFSNLAQQTWTPITTTGTIQLTTANFCLDLTNGNTTNQNVLQIWTCTAGDTNQIWSLAAV